MAGRLRPAPGKGAAVSPEHVEAASRRIWAAHVAERLTGEEVATLYRIIGARGVGVWPLDRPPAGARMRLRLGRPPWATATPSTPASARDTPDDHGGRRRR